MEVRTDSPVTRIDAGRVELGDDVIGAENIFWSAGVSASPLTKNLGVPLDRAGRITVRPDLSIPEYPTAFAIGDVAAVHNPDGSPVPGVAPAAMQMARHVAALIRHDMTRGARLPAERPAFGYQNRGTMATIGRKAAVAWIGRVRISGLVTGLTWLGVHLIFLVGLRNKLTVLLQWTYAYVTFKRGARIIVGGARRPAPPAQGPTSQREPATADP